jgi:hypothetical protein
VGAVLQQALDQKQKAVHNHGRAGGMAKFLVHVFFALFDGKLDKTDVVFAEIHAALIQHGHRVDSATSDDEVGVGELCAEKRDGFHGLEEHKLLEDECESQAAAAQPV